MGSQPDSTQQQHAETVGLLFVHGIGQQKPFEHLARSVGEIAELLKRDGQTSCSVVDRTAGWQGAVGAPTAMGEAPITLHVRRGRNITSFECHEVYWADLGARDGIIDTVKFWFWGLGQWAAPVYRDLDAAQLTKDNLAADGTTTLNRQASQLARLPRSVAGYAKEEVNARWQLALAGLAALLTAVSWSLVKRVFAAAFRTAPSPSVLVQYVGDVRTYEEGARPGDTALSDPGFPRRVGIRRRMVTQMVAMGDRAAKGEYDRWYVLGHSLGSVLAYNGLTEIGHTLPNYLGKEQWASLEPSLQTDQDCEKRPEEQVSCMMPARPPWLAHEHVINRRVLFEKLSGILTYGSPLNKFAGLWPRIVATATDRLDRKTVFPERKSFRWLNMRAPLDPVSGDLDRYGARNMGPSKETGSDGSFETPSSDPLMPTLFDGYVPSPETYTTPFWQVFLQAHLDYFRNQSAFARGYPIEHRVQLARWLLDPDQQIATPGPLNGAGKVGMFVVAVVVVLLILALTAVMGTIAFGTGWHLFTATMPNWSALAPDWLKFGTWLLAGLRALARAMALAFVIALGAVLLTGLLRWRQDSLFNRRTAEALLHNDGSRGLRQTNRDPTENEQQLRLHTRQVRAASIMIVLFVPVLLSLGLYFCKDAAVRAMPELAWLLRLECIGGYIVLLCGLAMVVQAHINTMIKPLRKVG